MRMLIRLRAHFGAHCAHISKSAYVHWLCCSCASACSYSLSSVGSARVFTSPASASPLSSSCLALPSQNGATLATTGLKAYKRLHSPPLMRKFVRRTTSRIQSMPTIDSANMVAHPVLLFDRDQLHSRRLAEVSRSAAEQRRHVRQIDDGIETPADAGVDPCRWHIYATAMAEDPNLVPSPTLRRHDMASDRAVSPATATLAWSLLCQASVSLEAPTREGRRM